MPQFEIFRCGRSVATSTPYVTVLKRGAFSLNPTAHAALGSPASVDLLYDVGASIVGIQSADPDSQTAHRVRPTTEHGPVVVSAMAFMRFHRLDVSVTTRWVAYVDEGVLCFDLKSGGVPVTSNRAGTGRAKRDTA